MIEPVCIVWAVLLEEREWVLYQVELVFEAHLEEGLLHEKDQQSMGIVQVKLRDFAVLHGVHHGREKVDGHLLFEHVPMEEHP